MKSLWTTLVIVLASLMSEAQESFQVLGRFPSEGDYPTGLVEGPDGHLYGTTAQGEGSNAGNVFRFDPVAGTYEVVHSFTGSYSESGMVLGPDGMLYGTTIQGDGGYGAVFRIDAQGNHSVLHTFDFAKGAYPYSGLLLGSDGNLYGTTNSGGDFLGGTVYRIDPQGDHTVLYSFNPAAGDGNPYLGGLVEGSDGSFYGTTTNGGPSDLGTIYRVDGLGNYTILHSFDVAGGGYQPYGTLVLASDGNYYGTTNNGGAFGVGDLFRMDHQGNVIVIYSFGSSFPNGYSPMAGLVEGSDGLLYGTTTNGGQFNSGTIFRISTTGSFELVHSFNRADGYLLYEDPLIQASDGNLYGVTRSGGGTDVGTLFKITTGGTFTLLRSFGTNLRNPRRLIQGTDGRLYGTALDRGENNLGGIFRFDLTSSTRTDFHDFQANEGRTQYSGLIQASDGNFYGTTDSGGAEGVGTVFELTPGGTHSTLHSFSSSDGTGHYPYGSLYQASDGNLYGMTSYGGTSAYGTIYRVTLAGAHTVIHSFDSTNGANPDGNLIEGNDGLLYGVTPVGGLNGLGTVFKVAKDGASFAVIHSFESTTGTQPSLAGLVEGSAGVFYGVAASGGTSGYGVVYEIASDGEYTVLHSFDGTHGANPYAAPVLANDGRLYGTTVNGGYWGLGTLYRITTGGAHTVVHNFDGTNGANPMFGVIQGADGAFYGATSRGGYPYIDVLYRWVDDTTPPETGINSAPPAATNLRNASFEFTSSETFSTFECSLDGEPFTPCFTPHGYVDISEGPHTFLVRAIDFLSNVDPTPASHSWTVDLTPPETTITSAPPALSNSTTATFEFTSSEPGSTFECHLDGNPSACTSPKVYPGIGDGTHNFSVWAKDPAGNVDPDGAYHFWTIDTAAPETTVTSGPLSPTNGTSATFEFTSSDPAATFECRLDGGAFDPCASPHSYSGLAEGLHTFEVRSQSAGTNPDPTPAIYQWVIDTTPPDTLISAAPPVLYNVATAIFEFHSSEGSGNFECSLDGGEFAFCASPQVYSALTDGAHSFLVRAVDGAGNADPTPASHSWTIDAAAPNTTITLSPPALSNSASATFEFTATEPASSFECRLDAGSFAPCTSPQSYSSLAQGPHNFLVRATDSAGNTDPTPASHFWTVDTTPPDTSITSAPPAISSDANATFAFTASEPSSSFECQLDAGGFAPCPSPRTYSGLSDGPHNFVVRATDPAGNTDLTPAAHSWTVDTTAPETTITSAPPAQTDLTNAMFEFTSSEPGSSFECRLDGGSFAPCTSPQSYSGLAEGTHSFQVRAKDGVDNTDPTPASHAWTVSTTRTLTVVLAGTGMGTVTSVPFGIDCPGDCAHEFPFDTSATLTPTAASNSTFTGWSGDPDCSDGIVVLNADKSCTANFSAGGPDLVVMAVSAPPAAAVPGSRFQALETTRNQGGANARSSQTRFYFSTDLLRDPSDVPLNGAHAVPLLGPGAESMAALQVTIPATIPFGQYYLLACADDAARVAESNETNNCLSATSGVLISRPDLQMTSLNGPGAASPGGSISIDDTVVNQGGIDARESRVRYYVSLDPVRDALDLRLGGARDVPLLTPGAVSTGTAALSLPRTTPLGTYYLIGCADDTSRVVESNEGNNCLVSPGTLLVTQPDLIVTAFSAPPTATRGSAMTLEETVTNVSPVASRNFRIRYYFSADGVLDALDPRLSAARLVNGLAAGASSVGATNVPIQRSLVPGTYFVYGCADDPSQVIETDETNNCAVSQPLVIQ